MAVYELERERKLDVAEGFLLPELPGERLRTVTLVSAYHDTPDRRLAAAGITLRRRTRARSVRWQLKLPAEGGRFEIELAGRGTEPPPEAFELLSGAPARSAARPRRDAPHAPPGPTGRSATRSPSPTSSTTSSRSTTSRPPGPAWTRSRSSSCRPATSATCAGSRRRCAGRARWWGTSGRRCSACSTSRPRRRDPGMRTHAPAERGSARCSPPRCARCSWPIPPSASAWAPSRCTTSGSRRGACGRFFGPRGRGSTSAGPRGCARSSGWLAGETSAARDLDVLVEELQPRVERLGEPDSEDGAQLLDGLTADRAAARAPGARRAREPALLRARRAARRRGWEPAALGPRARPRRRSSRASTGGCERRRAARGRRAGRRVMHRLRIAGKRVRYAAELAALPGDRRRRRPSSARRRISRTCSAPTRTPSSPRSGCGPWRRVPSRPWPSPPAGSSSRRSGRRAQARGRASGRAPGARPRR